MEVVSRNRQTAWSIAGLVGWLAVSVACSAPAPEAPPEGATTQQGAEQKFSIEPEMAPLPELDWDQFPEKIRNQIREVYDPAAADPNDDEAVGKLGMMLQAHMIRPAAEQCYLRARALAPKAFRWTYYHAILSKEMERSQAAIELARRAVKLGPDYAPARVRLGDYLMDAGQLDESGENYQKAIEIDPELASAHLGLGRVLAARKQWQEAVKEYERATKLESGYGPAYYGLGMAYRQEGKPEKARAAVRRYQQVKNMATPSFDPVYEAVPNTLGVTVEKEAPSLDIPKSGLEQVANELEGSLRQQPMNVAAHATLIAVYWQEGNFEKAREHYQAGLKINPNDASLHYNWGLLQLLRGDLAQAGVSLEKAIKLDPQHADALVQYGVLQERLGRPAAAVPYYEAALKINPDHRRAHFRLGIALFSQGKQQEGLRHFLETTKIQDRETPRFLLLVARTYARMGDRAHTKQYLGKARDMAVGLGMNGFVVQLDDERQKLLGSGAANAR